MATVTERFLKYVGFDTQSKDDVDEIPSTHKQFELAHALADEMREMGLSDVVLDEHCYVYAHIPANAENLPCLGFVAHMDTATSASGKDVKARIEHNYQGGDIVLSEDSTLYAKHYPHLQKYIGQDIIVTDGSTLLGGDDKAGIAEILTMAERLLKDSSIVHGKIAIAFTPDEEVGRGTDAFDVPRFGADFAYTVDGGEVGELEYENFNAASARITVHGREIHPGSAKDIMINAIEVAMAFHALLDPLSRPELTEHREGFFHLMYFDGGVEKTEMAYIIRDHDTNTFKDMQDKMRRAAHCINARYGANTIEIEIKESYLNMKEMILPHFHLIETAQAAMRENGVEPIIIPVRGGTDGARLSYMGVPCPNICTGGHNAHGRDEYIPVQAMEKVVNILVSIVKHTYFSLNFL